MNRLIPLSMLISLLLTLAFEILGAVILGVEKRRDLAVVALAQLATNPIVVITSLWFNLRYGLAGRTAALAVLEPLAVISEAVIYKKALEYCKIKPLMLSFLLNCFSFVAGEILNHI